MNRRTIPVFFALLALFLASAWAGEQHLSTIASGGGALSSAPSLARGGGRLAVAAHVRGAAGQVAEVSLFDETSGELMARRALSSGRSLAANPKVAASPSGFGVAWFDDESGSSSIRFASVDRSGASVVPARQISDGVGSAFDPVIVRGAGEWGVFWFQFVDGGSAIHFAAVSDDGAILVGPKRISDSAAWGHYPAAEFVDGRYGVAWHSRGGNHYTIRFRAFDRAGDPLSVEQGLGDEGGSGYYPSIAVGHGSFAVAWHELRDGAWRLFFRKVGFDGAPLGGAMSLAGTGPQPMFPSLGATADGWVLSWSERRADASRVGLRLLSATPRTDRSRPDRFLGGEAGARGDFSRVMADGRGALVAYAVLENGRESIRLDRVDFSE